MRLFVSTADASGDLHAAALVEALRRRDPALELFGLGGPALEMTEDLSVSDGASGGASHSAL